MPEGENMRTIANKKDSKCLNCGKLDIAMPIMGGYVMCSECESLDVINYKTQKIFEPVYTDKHTFKASAYTPEIKDRRKSNRIFPKIKERRVNVLPRG